MCTIVNSTLKRLTRDRILNHLANMADTINRRPLVQDHPYVPEVGVPSQQPWGSNKER
jgi:hypothetical protein